MIQYNTLQLWNWRLGCHVTTNRTQTATPRAATTTIIPYAAHSLFPCELLIEEARRWVDSDAESTLDEDEEYEHEDEGGNQYQPSADLPIHFLCVYIRRHHHNCSTTSDTEWNSSPKLNMDDDVAATRMAATASTTSKRAPPTPTSPSTPSLIY